MDKHSGIKPITLNDLWFILVNKILIIVLVSVVAVSGFFVYQKLSFVPEYESTAILYILKQNSEKNTQEALEDFSLALNVVNDCDYLLKSHSVVDEVIKRLDLDITYTDLSASITTANPENTRILKVTVVSKSPELSKKIVDNVCEIGAKRIEKAMGFKQVNLFEYGIIDRIPVNVIGITTYLIIALISAVVTYTGFLFFYLFDDKIKSDEDVQKYLGLHVIGNIPNIKDHSSNHYKYYKNRNKYATYDKESKGE